MIVLGRQGFTCRAFSVARPVSFDPNVWTGGALQEKSVRLECSGLAPMYPAFGWSAYGSWPSWI